MDNRQQMKSALMVSAVVMVVIGIGLMTGGFAGFCFTYISVAQERIVTPDDAVIPNTPVRGPLTLLAQANIIREHMLKQAKGLTYSEMPREIPKLDADGKPVVDDNGKAVMTPNTARTTWVTATTLMSALHLGVLSYAFAAFVVFMGFVFALMGIMLFSFRRLL